MAKPHQPTERRFWVLTPECELYEDCAVSVDEMASRFKRIPDSCPLDCQFCIHPQRRVYMIYWSAPLQGPVTRKLNFPASRILVDRFLLDTPPPARPRNDHAAQMKRAMRCCPHGIAVIFRVDEHEQLLDYPAPELCRDWSSFFVGMHPCCDPAFLRYLSYVPYTATCSPNVRNIMAHHVLRERVCLSVTQVQRIETVVVGHNLFANDPERWLKLSDIRTYALFYRHQPASDQSQIAIEVC